MFLTYLMFVVALLLSAVAAFYSIVGLTAIFAAAVIPIVIMGTILEVAKVTVTIWLHEYWRQCRLLMKVYLVPAVFTLMVITSMGIFGFLSKAHLDQVVPTGDVQAQVALIDEKINNERDTIANARTLLGQLDRAVSDIGSAPDREVNGRVISSAERALQVRRQQARDRANLTQTIEQAQARIVRLQEEKAPFAKDLRKIEAEVGPVKYIAALIYGDNPDANLLEKAVRWVIIILVAVFDPLAIMMLLAATESLKWERDARQRRQEEEIDDNSISSGPPSAAVSPESEQGIYSGAPADQPPDSDAPAAQQPDPGNSVSIRSDGTDDHQQEPDHQSPGLEEPVKLSSLLYIDPRVEVTTVANDEDSEEHHVIKQAKTLWKQDHPDATLKEQRNLLERGMIDHLPWEDYLEDPRIMRDPRFGKEIPSVALKGDLFIDINRVPSRVLKYNGERWIEIDKHTTDQYTYNDAYIDFIIESIHNGTYDPEFLSEGERWAIEQKLKKDL